ncbi:MAG: hypothetical protein WC655_27760 [Candidatus Hydrogenedentales bacterium]|jgi:hypothetical protein
MSETYGILHIYAQHCEHDEARIVGNREGLIALAAVVARALESAGEVESDHVFCNDGEGYRVSVRKSDVTSDLPKTYKTYYISGEIQYWRERAFEAEAKISRLRREADLTPKEPQ